MNRWISSTDPLVLLVNEVWKIGDFGLTMPATSKRAVHTPYSRGTASYRAPEVVQDNQFNSKADIWALGCIIWELTTGTLLFPSDWAVSRFADKRMPGKLPSLDFEVSQEVFAAMVDGIIPPHSASLEIDPTRRPTAEELLKLLRRATGWNT